MATKGRKHTKVRKVRKAYKSAEEMARRPMPRPSKDMGDRSKYDRRSKYKRNWSSENGEE